MNGLLFRYCGQNFNKTVQSMGNILGFTFTQTFANSMSQISTFEAEVSFIRGVYVHYILLYQGPISQTSLFTS